MLKVFGCLDYFAVSLFLQTLACRLMGSGHFKSNLQLSLPALDSATYMYEDMVKHAYIVLLAPCSPAAYARVMNTDTRAGTDGQRS